MVCKEEVFLWFNQLSGADRVGAMHGLLNMCLPFELRFLATCIEELCQKNFDFLREHEYKANSPLDVGKLLDLSSAANRSRCVVSLALLRSSNSNCSSILFGVLIDYVQHCLSTLAPTVDATTIGEIVLLFTLALYHPAFTFEQKNVLEQYLNALTEFYRLDKPDFRDQECCELRCQSCHHPVSSDGADLNSVATVACDVPLVAKCSPVTVTSVPPFGSNPNFVVPVAPLSSSSTTTTAEPPNVTTVAPSPTPFAPSASASGTTTGAALLISPPPPLVETEPPGNLGGMTKCNALPTINSKVQIKYLELKNGPRRKKGDKRFGYRIQVTWSNGEVTEISRSHTEMFDFHQKLLNYLQETRVPYFTGPKQLIGLKGDEISEDSVSRMNEYLRQLIVKVPHNIINSDFIASFFVGASSSAGPPLRQQHQGNPTSPSSVASHSPSPPLGVPSADGGSPASQFRSGSAGFDKLSQQIRSLSMNNTNINRGSGEGSASSAGTTGAGDTVTRSRPHHQSPEPAQTSPSTRRPSGSMGTPKQQEVTSFPPEWDRILQRYPNKEQLLNLSEEILAQEGLGAKQIKQIVAILDKLRNRLPNGFTNHLIREDPPSAVRPSATTRPATSAVPVQSNSHNVQTVQTQVYMPDASMDLLVYCSAATPAGSPTSRTVSRATESYSSCSTVGTPCNGDGPASISYSSLERHNTSPLSPGETSRGYSNCDPTDRAANEPKDGRPRRSSRNGTGPANGGNPQKVFKPKTSGGGGTKPASTVGSSQKRPVASQHSALSNPGNDEESDPAPEESSPGSPGPLQPPAYDVHYYLPSRSSAPPPPHHNGMGPPPPTLGGSEDRGQQQQPLLVKAPNGSFAVPPSSHLPQQQMQQMSLSALNAHLARLPSRVGGGVPSQSPSGVQGSPPPPIPHPSMPYPFMPLHLFSTYMPAHHSNGFVGGTPTGVPPPNFAFMHSPEESIAFQAMFQTQPPPPQQQQQPGGSSPTPQQRLPLGSAMPGFVAGPTPNVGFHGSSGSVGGGAHHGPGAVPPGMALHGQSSFAVNNMLVMNGRRAKLVCYNCGAHGHHGSECNEPTMEDLNKSGHFNLTYTPSNKSFDG